MRRKASGSFVQLSISLHLGTRGKIMTLRGSDMRPFAAALKEEGDNPNYSETGFNGFGELALVANFTTTQDDRYVISRKEHEFGERPAIRIVLETHSEGNIRWSVSR